MLPWDPSDLLRPFLPLRQWVLSDLLLPWVLLHRFHPLPPWVLSVPLLPLLR